MITHKRFVLFVIKIVIKRHPLFSVLWSSQTYLKFVEQLLQRHVLFRNTLQERLTAEHWKSLVGDILVQLIGQNDVSWCSFLWEFLWFQATRSTEGAHDCSDLGFPDSLFRYVPRIHDYSGVIPLTGVQQTKSPWEKSQNAGILTDAALTLFSGNVLRKPDMLMDIFRL